MATHLKLYKLEGCQKFVVMVRVMFRVMVLARAMGTGQVIMKSVKKCSTSRIAKSFGILALMVCIKLEVRIWKYKSLKVAIFYVGLTWSTCCDIKQFKKGRWRKMKVWKLRDCVGLAEQAGVISTNLFWKNIKFYSHQSVMLTTKCRFLMRKYKRV